jgi:hypothetical protein
MVCSTNSFMSLTMRINSPTTISYSLKARSSLVSLFLFSLISSSFLALSPPAPNSLLYSALPYSSAPELMEMILSSMRLFFSMYSPFWVENLLSSWKRKCLSSYECLRVLWARRRARYLRRDLVRVSAYYLPSRLTMVQKFLDGSSGMMNPPYLLINSSLRY